MAWLGAEVPILNDDGTVRRTFTMTDEDCSYIQVYLDAVANRVKDDAQLFIEQKLDTGIVSRLYGPITGTGDAIIAKASARRIEVHDLKFGRGVKVFAKDNEQCLTYALGVLHDYAWLADFDEVLVAIHQPRLDHYDEHVYTVAELRDFEAAMRARVAELDAGATDEVPGDHCKFCPRKVQCKALEKTATDAALIDFADVSDLTERGIAAAMDKVELAELWAASVRAEARRLLDAGAKVPGWCLEEGRAGNRKWGDEDEAAAKLSDVLGGDVYKPKALISPADAEKKLAKKHPQWWALMQNYIVRGAPTINMVRDDGKRTPYSPASLDAFKEIA